MIAAPFIGLMTCLWIVLTYGAIRDRESGLAAVFAGASLLGIASLMQVLRYAGVLA